jgi:cellulase
MESTRTVTTPCTTTYPIPGPSVWSGAYAETTAFTLGPVSGATTVPNWSTWIKTSVVTSATFTDKKSITVVGTSTYEPHWSTTYQTPAAGTQRW